MPVPCFVDGDWPLTRRPTAYADVRLEGTRSIRKLLSAGRDMDDIPIVRLHSILAAAFPPK